MPSTYFVVHGRDSTPRVESCSPYAAALTNKHVWLSPEFPVFFGAFWGYTLDIDKLKPMCEQTGAKVMTRGCGKGPTRTRPGYDIVSYGNETEDDADVNMLFKAGAHNSIWSHAIRPRHPAFMLHATNIPRSPNIHEATDQAFGDDVVEEEPEENICCDWAFAPTDDMPKVLRESEVKQIYKEKFGGKLSEVTTTMREMGFIFNINNGRGVSYATYKFPEFGRWPVKRRV